MTLLRLFLDRREEVEKRKVLGEEDFDSKEIYCIILQVFFVFSTLSVNAVKTQ